MRISIIQPDIVWEDPAANIEMASAMVADAAGKGASVAVLPEMFSTGFSMDAHSVPGVEDVPAELARLARENSISIIAGTAAHSRTTPPGLNRALAYDSSGELIAGYSKMHPFSFAGEDRHYVPGPGPVTFELGGQPSSVFICYDLRFPEVFRSVARKVKVIYVIASWPAARQEHWATLLRARAIEDQCFVVGVNRVGTDGNGVSHAGGSCVFGPFGEVVFSAGQAVGVYDVELDIALVDRVRAEYPFLDDMR